MLVRDTFAKDINRYINGVVKVEEREEEGIRQELEEYVVTRELQKHFARFLQSYTDGLDRPTDRIGVWISGFFGSGKSHFLKMLSYLLENKTVAGKQVIDYFDGKLADGLVAGDLRRAAEVPTESILFNIDSIAGHWKDGDTAETALLRAFERAFYDHLGFYGTDFKLARLEEWVAGQGKTDAFREAFESINGEPWVDVRSEYGFWLDDIADALEESVGMSRDAVLRALDNDNDVALPPDEFAAKVAAYTLRREQECRAKGEGEQFRLLFMVDEVGQFIGDNVGRMLTLQTIVENLGASCGGRAWVMVTSQEAIDEMAMVVGDDFSKIQGRFNTRLSLSSSSVDEVIKRRVLDKTEAAGNLLRASYQEQGPVLRNLFSFDDSQGDLGGYDSASDYAESFPFVGYQFTVLPNVMTAVRKSGIKAKHMSTGERSMLSAFQESAQAVQNGNLDTLVPFWRFFDTISKDLEHGIIQVVDRATRAAEANQGLRPQDVRVLKALYLIRYITDIRSTAANIAILMIERVDVDKVALREDVKASLDRLVRENYVSRQGELYTFLTDEEQDIEREVSKTQVDTATVIERIKRIVFDGIYTTRKYHKGANDYPVDRYVDDTVHGAASGGMRLNVITYAHELSQTDDQGLALRSAEQALVVLSDTSEYYSVVERAEKIARYVRTQNVSLLPPSTQDIIKRKQAEARACENEAHGLLEDALVHARCAVAGRMVSPRATKARDLLDAVLDELVGAVFTKAGYIDAPAKNDQDVQRALAGQVQAGLEGLGGGNSRACDEVLMQMDTQERIHQQTLMGDLQRRFQKAPYGWREVDVAQVVAQLIAAKRVKASLAGKELDPTDRRLVQSLRGKQADQLVLKLRKQADAGLLRAVRDVLLDLNPGAAVPEDEDALVAAVRSLLESWRTDDQKLLHEQYQREPSKYPYPGRKVVEDVLHLVAELQDVGSSGEALLKAFDRASDEVLDHAEDMERVHGFFPNQQRIWDAAAAELAILDEERAYLEGNTEVMQKRDHMQQILLSSTPYRDIAQLGQLTDEVSRLHKALVADRQHDLLNGMQVAMGEVRDYADDLAKANGVQVQGVLSQAERQLAASKAEAHSATTMTKLDALSARLNAWRDQTMAKVDTAVSEAVARGARARATEAEQRAAQAGAAPVKTARVTTADAGGSAARPMSQTPVKAAPKIKVLRREAVCPVKALSSEADVDAYVESIREKLLAALQDNDTVRVG